MSDSTTATPSGGMANTFKQRHEAYQLARDGRDVLDGARDALADGYAKAAAGNLNAWISAVERNPQAGRMVEARHPGLMAGAKAVHAKAIEAVRETDRADRDRVTATSRGEWSVSMDGSTETRLSFGKSAHGHHYRLETATYNSERDSGWSVPLRTEQAALRAGYAAEQRASGDGPERARDRVPVTPRAEQFRSLDRAAEWRQTAERYSTQGEGRLAERSIGYARVNLKGAAGRIAAEEDTGMAQLNKQERGLRDARELNRWEGLRQQGEARQRENRQVQAAQSKEDGVAPRDGQSDRRGLRLRA